MKPPPILAALASAILLPPPTPAQELVWEREGSGHWSTYDWVIAGGDIAVLGDIDGDGYADIVDMVGGSWPQLHFYSGRDGTLLRAARWPIQPGQIIGPVRIAAAGDMNGDGYPEYLATIGDSLSREHYVEVRSARDDRLLWRTARYWRHNLFGRALLGDLDVDGDGRRDVVLYVAGPSGSYGEVRAFSNSGAPLWTVQGSPANRFRFSGPYTLGRVGDLDGDGCDDIIAGALDDTTGLGVAVVLSGRTGQILRRSLGTQPNDLIGGSVDGAGDLDGDGVPDYVAASEGSPFSNAVVSAFSGATGQPIWTWRGPFMSGFGRSTRSSGIDLDRDGVPDVVVATGGGSAKAFSGRDGTELLDVVRGSNFGWFLAVTGPQPGSPLPYFIVTDPWHQPPWALDVIGRVSVYRGAVPAAEMSGASCRGTLGGFPRIGIRGLGRSGARVHLHGAEPGAPAALLVGLSRTTFGGHSLPFDLNGLGFPGCLLRVSVAVALPTATGTSGLSRGYASVDLSLALAGRPPGTVPVHGQWVVLGSGPNLNGGVSEALTWYH